MLCARECPDWCIHIDSHAETEVVADAGPGARPRTVHVLDRFAIDFGLCLYCGICIDVCPFDALAWVPVPTVPAVGSSGLVHEREDLAAAWASVPTAASEPSGAEG
jgi:NADH-quinone oxidoreductase subunit I